jgi:chaperonin cofactor prefoldin
MHDALTLGLTIGSPLFAVMFGLLLSQRSLDRLEDRINARLSRIDARMDRLEARMDRLEVRMDRLEGRVESIKDDQARFFETLASHDAKIGVLMDGHNKA